MSLAFDQDRQIISPDAFSASRRAVLADKAFFTSHPTARSRLRPMIVGEFGELEPTPPANLPDGMQASLYILVEPRSREPNGWPRRLSRRLIIVLQPGGDADAQTCEALRSPVCGDPADPSSSHQADSRQARRQRQASTPARADAEPSDSRDNPGGDQTSPVKKRPRGGRPRGANPQAWQREKMSRPLKAAIDDLQTLLNAYGFNVRIGADAIELSVDATSAASTSAWATQAAARLRAEYANCLALRRHVAKWAAQQMAET